MRLDDRLIAALTPHADVAGRGGEPSPRGMANDACLAVADWLDREADELPGDGLLANVSGYLHGLANRARRGE